MFTIAKQIAAAQTSVAAFIAAGIFYYVFNLIVAVGMEAICLRKLDPRMLKLTMQPKAMAGGLMLHKLMAKATRFISTITSVAFRTITIKLSLWTRLRLQR